MVSTYPSRELARQLRVSREALSGLMKRFA